MNSHPLPPLCGLFICLISFVSPCLAVQQDVTHPDSPDALSTKVDATPLIATLRSLGWISSTNQGLEFSGTLTRFLGDQSTDTQIHAWAFGPARIRLEIEGTQGTSSFVIRDGAGMRTPPGKASIPASAQTTMAAHQWIFPWLLLDSSLASGQVDKVLSALVQGEQATGYEIRPKEYLDKSQLNQKDTPYDWTFTIWISGKGLPLRIDYLLPAEDNRYTGVPCSRVYKDYQSVEGVLVPKEEEEYLGDQRIARLKFSNISILPSIDESRFTLPSSGRSK